MSSDGPSARDEAVGNVRCLRFGPGTFASAQWSLKQWNVLDGLKANGAGHGHFEYRVPWPADLEVIRRWE